MLSRPQELRMSSAAMTVYNGDIELDDENQLKLRILISWECSEPSCTLVTAFGNYSENFQAFSRVLPDEA